jgi:hypothetical protein
MSECPASHPEPAREKAAYARTMYTTPTPIPRIRFIALASEVA